MPSLTMQWDSSGVVGYTDGSVERATLRAASKAGGDAIRAMRVLSSKTVREKKRVKVAKVNAALQLVFPKTKTEDMEWRIDVSGAVTPVIDFPSRQNRRGVMAGINTGKSVLIQSAFIATMRSGHRGVFQRVERGAKGFEATKKVGKRGLKFRVAKLPIHELFTTRVADVFDDPGVVPAVMERGREVFETTFSRLLPLELDKLD